MDRNSPEVVNTRTGSQGRVDRHGGNFNDARMEAIMGRLLQMGVLLAASVMLAGGVLYVFAHRNTRAAYHVFVAKPVALRHPAALLKGLSQGNASAIIDLGILLLVATPILRVASGVVGFALERDRLYVTVSVIVLAVLLFGMLHAS